MKLKNFEQYVKESYSLLEGKEHKFADIVYRKISDELSDLYDISDKFYGDILHMAITYYDKKKEASTVADFISSQKVKLDKLIDAERKKSEKAKNKDIKSSKGKDHENDNTPDVIEPDEDE